jgi:hypothetical protein
MAAGTPQQDSILVPVSLGEVVDKLTILRIKASKITDADKLQNVRAELDALDAAYRAHVGAPSADVEAATERLLQVNQKLWAIEDDIRECERRGDFGPDFVRLARSVYFTNDDRMRLKREINGLLGSALVEEKSYSDYGNGPV